VLSLNTVTVIVKNDLIEELVELVVSVVGTSVNTDTGINVLNTGEDASFESNIVLVLLILVFLPNFLGEALAESRFAVSGEYWEFLKILRGLESASS